ATASLARSTSVLGAKSSISSGRPSERAPSTPRSVASVRSASRFSLASSSRSIAQSPRRLDVLADLRHQRLLAAEALLVAQPRHEADAQPLAVQVLVAVEQVRFDARALSLDEGRIGADVDRGGPALAVREAERPAGVDADLRHQLAGAA